MSLRHRSSVLLGLAVWLLIAVADERSKSFAQVSSRKELQIRSHERVAASILTRPPKTMADKMIPDKTVGKGTLREAVPELVLPPVSDQIPPSPPANFTPSDPPNTNTVTSKGTSRGNTSVGTTEGPPAPPASITKPAATAPLDSGSMGASAIGSSPVGTSGASSEPVPMVDGGSWNAGMSNPVVETVVPDGSLTQSNIAFGQSPSMAISDPTGGADCGGCGECGPCHACGNGGPSCWMDTLSLWGGVEGFRNGFHRGAAGSFGFQEGVNWGSPWVFPPLGMNTQIGFRGTQTDFEGSGFTSQNHQQYFVTGGFFRRALWGWQGGFVADYLNDNWYASINLVQLRGELSWATPNGSSLGVWMNTSLSDDTQTSTVGGRETWESLDLYTAFYRLQSNQFRQGQWRIFGGVTGNSNGIVGTDFKLPIVGAWSLEPEFTYVIGHGNQDQADLRRESWNIGIQLVWYPGRALNGINPNLMPMFDVASNGSMIIRRR